MSRRRTTAFENFVTAHPEFATISQATFYRMRANPEILQRVADADREGLFDLAEERRKKRRRISDQNYNERQRESAPF